MGVAHITLVLEALFASEKQRNVPYEIRAEIVNIPKQVTKTYRVYTGQVHSVKRSGTNGPWVSHTIDLGNARKSLYTFLSDIEQAGWDSSPLHADIGRLFNDNSIEIHPQGKNFLERKQLVKYTLRNDHHAILQLQEWPEKTGHSFTATHSGQFEKNTLDPIEILKNIFLSTSEVLYPIIFFLGIYLLVKFLT